MCALVHGRLCSDLRALWGNGTEQEEEDREREREAARRKKERDDKVPLFLMCGWLSLSLFLAGLFSACAHERHCALDR